MGVNGIFGSLGPAFGPVIGAFIYDRTGDYFLAFLLGGVALLIGFGLILFLKPRTRTRQAPIQRE